MSPVQVRRNEKEKWAESCFSQVISSTIFGCRSGQLRSSSNLADRPGSRLSQGDVSECKKSLNDIRDRIGSLQSLLAQSRSLTSSRQQLLSDLPVTSAPGGQTPNHPPLITSPADKAKKEHFATHRNDSYSKAMDGDSDQIQVE